MKSSKHGLLERSAFGSMGDQYGVRFSFCGTAYLDRYAELLRPLSLTPSRVLALAFVAEHPGCDQMSFAEALGIKKAAGMSLINRMEQLDLIQRSQGASRRSNALHITPVGRTAFDAALEAEQTLHASIFGHLSPNDLDLFFSRIDEIACRLRDAPPFRDAV